MAQNTIERMSTVHVDYMLVRNVRALLKNDNLSNEVRHSAEKYLNASLALEAARASEALKTAEEPRFLEGMKYDIPANELKEHFENRKIYHIDKMEFYQSRINEMNNSMEHNSATNDPRTSLQSSVNQHKQRAGYFNFMAAHIIEEQTYRLVDADLSKLEFLEVTD